MKQVFLICGLLATVSLTYSNHFNNGFHFDDSHAVVDNPYIRSLSNIPAFFTSATAFSVLPANRTWRPMVTLSLALDYRLARGLKPPYFQASTFFWYLVQLALMYLLFRAICDRVRPDPRNQWLALFAAALYGLHPAMAETVNYVIQRGDVYSTFGVIAGLLVYALWPRARKYGFYLVPVALALLSKPPALVFPGILFAYVRLFRDAKPLEALKRCAPALALSCILGCVSALMTPRTWTPGAVSALAYRITQPLVALRYFRTFFIPDQLTADTDHIPAAGLFDGFVWTGFVFVVIVVLAAVRCSKKEEWKPAAFGLWWFLLALIPTAVFPLAEVENDHRMFFPFVGLALAACWPAALWIYKRPTLKLTERIALVTVCLTVLAGYGSATWQRNKVWHDDESLWYDVTMKSPRNGRGLMNYGLTQMAKGQTARALSYFEQAVAYTPAYYVLEINLGIANGALKRGAEAQKHFLRALQLAPAESISHYFYARWLYEQSRWPEAVAHIEQAIALNPDYLDARYLLMQGSAQNGNWNMARLAATSTLERFPSDAQAKRYVVHGPQPAGTPEGYLALSLEYHRAGRYQDSIDAARKALSLRPDYAEAYNNIAAAYEAMKQWGPAIEAANQALKLRPDFQLARNNLLWSQQQQKRSTQPG